MSRPSLAQEAARDVDRLNALTRLMAVIYDHEQHGEPVPCVDPAIGHLWVSSNAVEAEAAAWRCGGCPALSTCREYVTNHPEPAGVWAGVTPTERNSR